MNFRHQDEPDVGLPGHGRRRHESHLEPVRRRAHLRHETQVWEATFSIQLFIFTLALGIVFTVISDKLPDGNFFVDVSKNPTVTVSDDNRVSSTCMCSCGYFLFTQQLELLGEPLRELNQLYP